MEILIVGLFLAEANKAIVDYLFAPVRNKYPDVDLWWVVYVALATGSLLAWFAGVNLFESYISDLLVGRLVTCLVVGGGSSLIHNIFKRDEFDIFVDDQSDI